ncbi:DUF6691 family protein [Hydrogenophaga sp. BPS33]|uniref:DUF6691 family protein n=1 Tax=Hydrogenophaga sp. BPS33 TaxID=2651974 RepID=UPI00131FE5AE|nr:DUF6691 family protein [Hydrogenophaga sp. BPS33]QHE87065.1 hypothetical protein F9K07_20250 [Hydrogenophaga sp. BPS33]
MLQPPLETQRTTYLPGGMLYLPKAQQIDRRLVVGGLVFRVGWGLAGFCPGPALVAGAAGETNTLVFVAAMVVGMLVHSAVDRRT